MTRIKRDGPQHDYTVQDMADVMRDRAAARRVLKDPAYEAVAVARLMEEDRRSAAGMPSAIDGKAELERHRSRARRK